MIKKPTWSQCDAEVFWAEIAPCDHVVQIYETESIFIHTLEEFVTSGFKSNDCVIIIATDVHLKSLNQLLQNHGHDVAALKASDQFIPLNAEETLAKFMVNGWPDEELFYKMIKGMLVRAQDKGRQVRAFGEMVAILWASGHTGATVRLEYLWSEFCKTEAFCLFCAYPKSGFTSNALSSLETICATHQKVIDGQNISRTGIHYAIPRYV